MWSKRICGVKHRPCAGSFTVLAIDANSHTQDHPGFSGWRRTESSVISLAMTGWGTADGRRRPAEPRRCISCGSRSRSRRRQDRTVSPQPSSDTIADRMNKPRGHHQSGSDETDRRRQRRKRSDQEDMGAKRRGPHLRTGRMDMIRPGRCSVRMMDKWILFLVILAARHGYYGPQSPFKVTE